MAVALGELAAVSELAQIGIPCQIFIWRFVCCCRCINVCLCVPGLDECFEH